LGVPPPTRMPRPAATTTAAMSDMTRILTARDRAARRNGVS
jgi:hypothetical protein